MKSQCLFGIVASLLLFTFHVEAQGLDTIASKSNKQITLPEIGVNFGFVNLLSDVALNASGPNAFTQFGFQLNITQPVAKFLNVSLNLFTGTVYGEEMRGFDNLNYRTSLFSQQLCVEYNFYPLLKPNEEGKQLIRPYVGFGLGAMFFRSKGDLITANGETYNYWSDGTTRSIAENDAYAESAIIIQRDLEYESDLRDANLDGLRKYPQTTFTVPINAGIRFQITKNFGVNAAFSYALNFSEMLDNSGAASVGTRKSASGNDNHIFGSIGFNVFLGSKRPVSNRISEQILASTTPNRWGSKKQVAKLNSELSKPETQVSESATAVEITDAILLENSSVIANNQSVDNAQGSEVNTSTSVSNNLNTASPEQDLSLPSNQNENTISKRDADESKALNKTEPDNNSASVNPNSNNPDQLTTGGLKNLNQLTAEEKTEFSQDEISGKNSPALAGNDQAIMTSKDVTAIPLEERNEVQSNSNSKVEASDFANQNDAKSTQSNQEITTSKSSQKGQKNTTKSSENDKADITISKEPQDDKTESKTGQITLKDLQQVSPKATGTFHWADRDQNGTITATEVLFFIDSLFDGNGTLTVEDIQNLIDYYFDQE
jgi:hypothetical protein